MKRLLLSSLILAGCEPPAVLAPTPAECLEFDHRTERRGVPWICRMLWCERPHSTESGLATLWCSPVRDDGGGE